MCYNGSRSQLLFGSLIVLSESGTCNIGPFFSFFFPMELKSKNCAHSTMEFLYITIVPIDPFHPFENLLVFSFSLSLSPSFSLYISLSPSLPHSPLPLSHPSLPRSLSLSFSLPPSLIPPLAVSLSLSLALPPSFSLFLSPSFYLLPLTPSISHSLS